MPPDNMPEDQTPQSQPEISSPPQVANTPHKKHSFRKTLSLKSPLVLVFIALFGLVGGYFIIKSFAATPITIASNQVQLQGQLQILHKDNFKDKTSNDSYALVSDTGVSTPVDFSVAPLNFNGIANVKIKGTVKNGRVKVAAAKDMSLAQVSVPAETPHKTAVILYNYSDNSTAKPITAAVAAKEVFTGAKSANAFFKEESYGQRSLVGVQNATGGDVFGYYTISAPSSVCDEYGWADQASAAALADGHDLSAYDNVIFISPTTGCSNYGGFGEVSGRYSWVFINSSYPLSYSEPIIQHELTHNFGTWHANSYACVDNNNQQVAISDNCQFNEYGDPFDVMGYYIYYGHTYHSNDYFLHDLGWLPTATTVTKSGNYTITPAEGASPSATPVLRLIRSIDQYKNYQYIYLEYRQPYGFDDFAPTDPAVNGAMVRVSSGYDGTIASGLVFVHIGDINKGANPVMQDGDVFNDPTHNIKITQLSHSAAGVNLHIDVTNVPKPDSTPPSAPTNAHLVSATTRSITISGTASPESDVSSYKVYRGTKLVGYTYTTDSTITYTDNHKFVPGSTVNYHFKATDFSGNNSAPSAPLSVIVPPRDPSPPTAPGSLTGFMDGKTGEVANISWQPSTDNKAVTGYMVYRSGGGTGLKHFDTKTYSSTAVDTSFQDWYRAPGVIYTYYVKAYDSDLNYSPISNKIKL